MHACAYELFVRVAFSKPEQPEVLFIDVIKFLLQWFALFIAVHFVKRGIETIRHRAQPVLHFAQSAGSRQKQQQRQCAYKV